MIKKYISLSCCFFILLTAQAQEKDLKDINNCLVKIKVCKFNNLEIDSSGLIAEDYVLGTGVYISRDGLFLTAAHVIKDRNNKNPSSVICEDPQRHNKFTAVILFEDYDNDIALLRNENYTGFNKENKYYIDINNDLKNPKSKMEIFAFGFPNFLHNYSKLIAFSSGIITEVETNLPGYKKVKQRKNVCIADCEVISGFSGGLVTSRDFDPIGIVLGSILENNTRITFFKSLKEINKIFIANEIIIEN